jgi:hypothetical protein
LSGHASLRYVSISSTGLSGKVRTYHRHHFGWPMQALRIDSCSEDGTWYAKLDACKLGVNFVAASILAVGVGIPLAVLRQRRRRRIAPVTGPIQTRVDRRLWAVALGTILVTIPFLSWWGYCYAYEDQFLFKKYRWLWAFGRHLRLICLSGLVVYAATWVMLVRYCRGGVAQPSTHGQA